MKSTLILSISVKLKMTKVFRILNNSVMDQQKEFNLQNCALNKTFCYYNIYLR